MRESALQQEIRLALGRRSVLFRNNSGAYKDERGNFIRYGVGQPGGSDLIGWHTVTITPEMVGQKVALFLAVEVKTPNGRVTDAQQNFVDVVNKHGGIAGICRSVKDAEALIQAPLQLVL